MASHSPRYRTRGDLLKFDGEDFSELDGIGAKTDETITSFLRAFELVETSINPTTE